MVVGGQLVLRAGQSGKRLFSLLIPQIKQLEEELAQAPKEVLASMKAAADAAEKQQKSLETAYLKQHNVTTQQTKNIVQLA